VHNLGTHELTRPKAIDQVMGWSNAFLGLFEIGQYVFAFGFRCFLFARNLFVPTGDQDTGGEERDDDAEGDDCRDIQAGFHVRILAGGSVKHRGRFVLSNLS
jgi:hypothetical protein